MHLHLEAYWASIERHGLALGRAAASDLTGSVPTCPGWQLRDLVAHTAAVHHWAADIVRHRRPSRPDKPEPPSFDATTLLAWAARGVSDVVDALRDAPDDLACFVLFPGEAARPMWSRRMAHETLVHHVDVALTLDPDMLPYIPTPMAIDGVDEVLRANLSRPGRGPRSRSPYAITFEATDDDRRWTGCVDASGYTPDDTYEPHVTVRAPARTLYLLLWNRTGPADVEIDTAGEADLLEHWCANHRL